MRKIVALLIGVVVWMVGTVCIAAVSPNQAALGGIRPGAKMEAVKRIYGMPEQRELSYSRMDGDYIEVWTYGGSFEIHFIGDAVVFMKSTANNGIKTPAGFTVGSNINAIRNYLGTPFVEYNDCLWYQTTDGVDLAFYFINGKVYEIRTGFPD